MRQVLNGYDEQLLALTGLELELDFTKFFQIHFCGSSISVGEKLYHQT